MTADPANDCTESRRVAATKVATTITMKNRMNYRPISVITALLLPCAIAYAAPERIEVDDKLKPRSGTKHIEAVHQIKPNPLSSVAETRYAILRGMRFNRGVSWRLEGEGDGYINARIDYKSQTIIQRIEYSTDAFQFQYMAGTGNLACKNNQHGICYKGSNRYYKYTRKLINSINKELNTQVSAHAGELK